MGTLIELLSKRLGQNIRFAAQAESLLPIRGNADSECSWKVRLSGGEEIFARHVVISTPAYEAARLVETSAPDLSSLLSAISHTPMAVVSWAFERAAVRHNLEGFGFMVPRREGLSSFCTIWNSSLFDGRAPKGMVVLTTFARAGEDGELLTLPDEVLAKTIEAETKKILGITGEPVERQVWKYTRALPQYNLGHAEG